MALKDWQIRWQLLDSDYADNNLGHFDFWSKQILLKH